MTEVAVVNLRKIEEALKAEWFWIKVANVVNPLDFWIQEVSVVKRFGMNMAEEDFWGSITRSFDQQIYIENRYDEIVFVYPTDKDVVVDAEGKPVLTGEPLLNSQGDKMYDENDDVVLDPATLREQYYEEPKFFFDKEGASRITRFIPPNLGNVKPAIAQFYIEMDEWRVNPIGDGSIQKNKQNPLNGDMTIFNDKISLDWLKVKTRGFNYQNNGILQGIKIIEHYKFKKMING